MSIRTPAPAAGNATVTAAVTATATAAARSPVRVPAALAAVVLAGVTSLSAGTAFALPPGGASADTPGTSGTASPKSLKAGARLSFSIQGFPAGEVVSVKIDDGEFCSAKGQHGACVVHQQKVGKDGSARGSFALPDDVGPGSHWLRFLASAEMLDDDGNYLGVKPYSLRGNTDFTVVSNSPGAGAAGSQGTAGTGSGKTPASGDGAGAGGASGSGSGAGSGSGTGTGTGQGAGQDAGTTPGQGSAPTTGTVPTPGAATPGSTTPGSAASQAPGAVPADGLPATEAQPLALRVPALPADAAPAAAEVDEVAVPWIGAGVLAICVLLCSGLVAALRFGRRS